MQNIKYIFVFAATLFLLIINNIYPQKSNFEFKLSLEKYTFIVGEDVYLKSSMTNNGKEIDSLFNFNPNYLDRILELFDEEGKTSGFAGIMGDPDIWAKFNPGETLEFESMISSNRAFAGCGLLNYFPAGKYTLKNSINDKAGNVISSNSLVFKVNNPIGDELKAFNKYMYFINYYRGHASKPAVIEDWKMLIDKSIQFLYLWQ